MTTDSIPAPTYEQKCTDLAIARKDVHDAQEDYGRALQYARARNPFNTHNDGSVYLARLKVQSAENRLDHLINYYAPMNLTPTTQQPPINTGIVIEIEDSDDEELNYLPGGSSPGPAPAYSSWPSTPPHFYAALFEERQQQQPDVPSTPPRRSQDEGGSSQPLVTPSLTQTRQQTTGAPATPCHVISKPTTIVGENGTLTSPNPEKKHYIVTKGRRTGIYRSWPVAKGYVDGLGSSAAWQGFDTYQEAFEEYMAARERDLLKIIRLPGDTEARYGPRDTAEDL